MRTAFAWRRHVPSAALAAAFVATVILGRSLSASSASASESPQLLVETLPPLAREFGVKPIVTLVGRESIVRIGLYGKTRVFSVFDRAGLPLATRLTQIEFARQFPGIQLEEMRDAADGFRPSKDVLADTPDSGYDNR
ncbi:MAG: hypothetical protein KF691_12775 [Phycisphaeraceae bacterium]|nr:hypothetical protein [Phycisphaeraceae bacterium]